MKRRTTKKRVQEEENHLILCSREALREVADFANTISDKNASLLGSDLTFLLMERLRLEPSWPYKQRWLDCIQWDSLIAERPDKIRGKGQIWWGYLKNLTDALVTEPFEAEIQLQTNGGRTGVAYSLRFTLDSVTYHVPR
jgi:hypothetical protein